jgi:hypothetical protein
MNIELNKLLMSNEYYSEDYNKPLLNSVSKGRKNTYFPCYCAIISLMINMIIYGVLFTATILFVGFMGTSPRSCHYCKSSFELNNVTYTLHTVRDDICVYMNDTEKPIKTRGHLKLSCVIGISIGASPFLILMFIVTYIGLRILAIIILKKYAIEDLNPPFSCWPFILCKTCPYFIYGSNSQPSNV